MFQISCAWPWVDGRTNVLSQARQCRDVNPRRSHASESKTVVVWRTCSLHTTYKTSIRPTIVASFPSTQLMQSFLWAKRRSSRIHHFTWRMTFVGERREVASIIGNKMLPGSLRRAYRRRMSKDAHRAVRVSCNYWQQHDTGQRAKYLPKLLATIITWYSRRRLRQTQALAMLLSFLRRH